MRQAEKGPRFVGNVREVGETQRSADDVEEIAVLAGGGIGLMCS